jgi:hypothetical protein
VDLTYNGVSLVASLTQPTGATVTFRSTASTATVDMGGAPPTQLRYRRQSKVETAKGAGGAEPALDANRQPPAGVAATDVSGVGSGTITIERRSDGQPLPCASRTAAP